MTAKEIPKLTQKERIFCESYCSGKTYEESLRSANYKFKGKKQKKNAVWRLLRREGVKDYIKFLEQMSQTHAVASRRECLERLTAVIRSDVRQVVRWDEEGNLTLKLPDELEPKESYGISEISNNKGSKIKIIDKVKALSILMDYYNKIESIDEQQKPRIEESHRQDIIRRVSKFIDERKR